jgi:hypothetical protein
LIAGSIVAGLLAIDGTSAASAQAVTVQFTIANSGTALTLDSASCSPSASISAPFSIAAKSSNNTFSATGSGSILCTVRYKNGSDGCQFVVDGTNFGSFGGFANTNAYMGDTTPPTCTKNDEGTTLTGYQGNFTMTH